jgi:hypothetical protein
MAQTMMASASSFAAISTLLGSPALGTFLIMEVAGIGGAIPSLVALPGLLASGIGVLVFVGLDDAADRAPESGVGYRGARHADWSYRRLRRQQPAARTGSQDAPATACDPRQCTQRPRCSRCWLAVMRNGLAKRASQHEPQAAQPP